MSEKSRITTLINLYRALLDDGAVVTEVNEVKGHYEVRVEWPKNFRDPESHNPLGRPTRYYLSSQGKDPELIILERMHIK